MLKSLKIFLIILGLGVFILPTQTLSAQIVEQCCTKKSENNDCCKTKTDDACHSEKPSKDKGTSGCGNDCANCHTCSVPVISTYISTDIFSATPVAFAGEALRFSYEISFFSSQIHSIWQPPKLG